MTMKHSRGHRNLYEKMLRRAVESRYPNSSTSEVTKLMDLLHWSYKLMFNGGMSTKALSKPDFNEFFMKAQVFTVENFGVSGFDEDKFPFTQQPKS